MREVINETTVFIGMPHAWPRRRAVRDEVKRAGAHYFTGGGAYDGLEEPYLAMDSRDFLRMLEGGPASHPAFYQHIRTQECIGVVYSDDYGRIRMGTRAVPHVLRTIVKPLDADKEVCCVPAHPASTYTNKPGWIQFGSYVYYPVGE